VTRPHVPPGPGLIPTCAPGGPAGREGWQCACAGFDQEDEHEATHRSRGTVRQARDLASVLDAACDALEEILSVIGEYEDASDALGVPFLLAATPAANGRDAVLIAPSLPVRRLHQREQVGRSRSGGARWRSHLLLPACASSILPTTARPAATRTHLWSSI